jgi:tetratricopeptide (TPR) repeat protein
MARQALAKGQYDQAMDRYRSLVEEGQGLGALIADLETATEEHRQPLLRRLLGDAYMRNGQLQRALETYRIALDDL